MRSATFLEKLKSWKKKFDPKAKEMHFYHFATAEASYPSIEVIIKENRDWLVMYEGKIRSFDYDWMDLPSRLSTVGHLHSLLKILASVKSCNGLSAANYDVIIDQKSDILYSTTNGEPAAYEETVISNFHTVIIRSAHCSKFSPSDATVSTPDICDSCLHCHHYLRTLKSRLKAIPTEKESLKPKYRRLDQLKHEDLLHVARENSKKT
eukprot:Seg112.4 transcript_id=Seg112.4/GoldUCD/mRNA.D3Y31 product="hypothetical protein" protein_id=Seg112.4/GoldUCD/D3Y31